MSNWVAVRGRDGQWCLSGEGPLRPIAVSGETLADATENWLTVYGNQYAEAECMTANSVSWQQEASCEV